MLICPSCRASYEGNERFCVKDAAALVDRADFLRIGAQIGSYRLKAILGRGGMGTVYQAEHVYIGKQFAVKVLHERYARYDEAVRRFLREARAASSIHHPNIVDVNDFGPTGDGGVFIVMEYIDGKSLEDVIEHEAPLALHRSINILEQMASALARAHEQGIIHRDLKPENIMLTRRPGRREVIRASGYDANGSQRFTVEPEQTFDFVKVLDFGIAKVAEPEAPLGGDGGSTVAGTIFGTPEYMSPEAARGGPIDQRADIYSLGIIFYDMLVGHVPFQGGSPVEVLARQIGEAPLPPRRACPSAEITEAAEGLILKALAKDPVDRQQTMDELRESLKGCYGSIAYRRDALRVPGAAASGMHPRIKKLTEELTELLTSGGSGPEPLAAAVAAVAAAAVVEEADPYDITRPLPSLPSHELDWDALDDDDVADEAGSEHAPILLTKKKPPG